jgi:ATP-dependent exoDNAse (exonuclease V) beta subunit
MKPLGHVMILASAGSGKTYALTNRFVYLLARGARPERIVALTFTRKAAGEFFDEILRKLARAAGDPAQAQELATEIEMPALTPADFLRMLRAVVDAMHRLNLGTLDSFFARIVRSFPLELGLGGEFEILEEHAARLERQRVLRQMFARASQQLDAAQQDFIEAFKRATFGVEEKQLGRRLDEFIDEYAGTYRAAPQAGRWGDPAKIWPAGCPWLAGKGERATAAKALHAALPWDGLNDKQRVRLEAFFAALPEWSPGAPLPDAVDYLFGNALKAWPALAEIVVERRKLALPPAARAALHALVSAIIGAELARRLEMTRGIFAVLHGYEAVYHEAVRRGGRLTFADLQQMLLPEGGAPVLSSGAAFRAESAERETTAEREAVPPRAAGFGDTESARAKPRGYGTDSAEQSSADMGGTPMPRGTGVSPVGTIDGSSAEISAALQTARLAIDFRLDAQFDHWLLDEFQDTSFGQWSVLRNLIDEAVQDPARQRSFFYVGDVKQAIFAWREGDPRLFREIFDYYNAGAAGTIAEEHLTCSWRSGPAVIAMVNRVFGAGEALRRLFPEDAARRWSQEWLEHKSAKPGLGGYAELRRAGGAEGRFAATAEILRETQALARGLSVAVLVQRNDTAAALADFLRHEENLPAVAESDLHVGVDNPLSCALLSLLRAAAHPGDSLAWEHVQMTPLAVVLAAEGLKQHDAVTARLLGDVHADGFERTVERWLRKLEPLLAADDEFSGERGRQLAEAARVFDENGRRDVAEFCDFAARYTVRDPEAAGVVRVMTVHKAKGLGFDLVILPDLEGQRLARRREGLAVQRAADRAVEWVLDLPAKEFCAQDDELRTHVAAAEADACYEALCLLYVAMTRAKRAMYVLVDPVKANSTSHNYPKLLTDTLGETWAGGDPRWYEKLAPAENATPRDAGLVASVGASARVPRLLARTPSALQSGVVAGSALFAAGERGAADFGTAVHALFATIEWWEEAGAEDWLAARRAEGADAGALAEVLACLRASELAVVFASPGAGAEAWRERAFEAVIDGVWVTGVIDRVVVGRDAEGRARRAKVFDFKTDRVADESGELARAAQRHAGQIDLYRRVVARLTGLPETAVTAEIVFTAIRRRV